MISYNRQSCCALDIPSNLSKHIIIILHLIFCLYSPAGWNNSHLTPVLSSLSSFFISFPPVFVPFLLHSLLLTFEDLLFIALYYFTLPWLQMFCLDIQQYLVSKRKQSWDWSQTTKNAVIDRIWVLDGILRPMIGSYYERKTKILFILTNHVFSTNFSQIHF